MSQNSHKVHRFVSNDFSVRVAAVNATDVVREMQKLQGTLPLPTVAVGRAMVGATLMASHLKESQQIGLYVRGNGVMSAVYAEAHFEGQVRGYTPHALYEPAAYPADLSLHDSIGEGTLTVTRHQPFQKQPFQGTVELVSGEIGDDIAYYLQQSQQIRSLVSLGVYLDTYGKVRAAGGLLIEVMPGVEEAIVEKIQDNADKLKTTLAYHRRGFTGDGAFVDAGDAFDNFAIRRDQLAGFDQDKIAAAQVGRRGGFEQRAVLRIRQQLGHRVGSGAAQAFGSRAAAAFGDRFREGGEQHCQPQPEGDSERERGGLVFDQRLDADDAGQHGDHFGDEDHRVAHQLRGIELGETVARGAGDNGPVEQGDGVGFGGGHGGGSLSQGRKAMVFFF